MVQFVNPTDPNPGIDIEGVGWKVPRNSKFEVETLPKIFRNQRYLFFPIKNVWFDLFCIPQDASQPIWAAAKKEEISRQATISGSAYQAICWLNDINDWKPLQVVIQWLSSRIYRSSMPHEPVADAALPSNSTWELGGDGRVLMKEVSLVASSDPAFYPSEWIEDQHIWRVFGPDTENLRQLATMEQVCLHEYLREQLVPSLPGRCRHAVLIANTLSVAAGVILMQVYNDEEPVRTFGKICDFEWGFTVTTNTGVTSGLLGRCPRGESFPGLSAKAWTGKFCRNLGRRTATGNGNDCSSVSR